MKKTPFEKIILTLAFCGLFCFGSLWCQSDQRFFDNAPQKSNNIRLTALSPSLGDLQALVLLRDQNLIPIENLIVVNLYHEKQLTDFEKSLRFAKEDGRDWIKFHELRKDLHPETLFKINDLSDELLKIFTHSDGLILFGGDDIPPALYEEKTSLLTDIQTPFRSYLDTMVVFHLLGGWQDVNFKPYLESHPEFPILGLCLGSQSLNVGTGGTLFQDIPSEIYEKKNVDDVIAMTKENWHDNPYDELYPKEFWSSNLHRIKLIADGKFVSDWGFDKTDTPRVYSSHHQAVRKLGKGIKVIATSMDGRVVEAIEHTKYPNVLGVQFHPESRNIWDGTRKSRLTPDDKQEANLISTLENDPPSIGFHKKIWTWFSQKLQAAHKHRTGKGT